MVLVVMEGTTEADVEAARETVQQVADAGNNALPVVLAYSADERSLAAVGRGYTNS